MISLLEEVADQGFGSAAFLTYGADLGFFESKVMGALQESGCRNIIVVADGHQTKDALNSAAELRYIGVQYPLVPVRLGNQAFHPKAVLLVGEEKLKVLIGSGNLTLPGYTRNWEIFTRSEGENAAGLALGLLRVFEDAAKMSALGGAFADWRRRLEKYSPWLFSAGAERGAITLLSSSDGPILPRAVNLLGGREVTRLLAVSPFFDGNAVALQWLIDQVRPKELSLLVADGVQLNPVRVEEALASSSRTSILEFLGRGRPLHGKALLFEGSWGQALLAGSPNLSSAALLNKAGTRGNFELATFQVGEAREFSQLFQDKMGPPVDLAALHPRRPIARSNLVAPLELEAAWIQDGKLRAAPAARGDNPDTLEVRLERRSTEIARHRLQREADRGYAAKMGQEELARLEGTPLQACRVGAEGRLGPAVWIQNLDAVERRANPAQRPRYARGLQGLGKDSLGLDEDAWNSLFDAFLRLSSGWGEYARSFRPEKAKTTAQTSKPGEEKVQTWNKESFYVTLEDVRIELPAYFARVENSGWGIGDFEFLISALPTAGLVPAESPPGAPEAPGATEDEDEASKNNGSEEGEDEGEDDEGEDEGEKKERRKRLGNRLFRKFKDLVRAYEESIRQPVQNVAEATLVSSLYTALHVTFARAAAARLLDAPRFRELVSRLSYAWTNEVWTPMPADLRGEVEGSIGCATISLAATVAATSPWAREHAEDQDEFDADMFIKLARTLRELRPSFLGLKVDFASGKARDRWTKATDEYSQLSFEKATPLTRLEDLERRYEMWHLDDKSALQRELKKEGLGEAAELADAVLRVRAPLPNPMFRRELLGRLLCLIHEGVDSRAAVVWVDSQDTGTIRQIAMTLDPEQKAVLEATRYTNGNVLLWRHRASGGTSSGGVHLTQTRSLPSTLLHLVKGSNADKRLIDQAREQAPDFFR